VTETEADIAVEAAVPGAVCVVAKRAGVIDQMPSAGDPTWTMAAVLALAADAGLIEDQQASEQVLQLVDAVPHLLDDLRLGRGAALGMDVEQFESFLASCLSRWPGLPPRALRAAVALKPALGDVIRQRARHLGRPDPLRPQLHTVRNPDDQEAPEAR
jgi:hypothetical protein